MAMNKKTLMALVIVSVSLNVGAQVHHIVGGDHGWHPYTDIGSWSSATTFRVGDKIWFTHSAAQGRIAEVETREEYLACDVSNPIRMYSDDSDGISLDGEGVRYFMNSNSEKCKNGLKLHVEVVPEARTDTTTPEVTSEGSDKAIAAAPPESSAASSHFGACFALLMAGFWIAL
ncbi:PEELING CUPREDOXIN putative-RELATED [Salix purpurea]|uniref:PEELING CUPREDOXIN putative-RELATED n=1 Tax=Salix purpurea TaxID=77065 RepID=A0A9Q0VXT2_SALPP|nr:PEELING CUPREDOXIN putative-RELATED [Salix purpurea]